VTDDRQTDHATGKCARAIPTKQRRGRLVPIVAEGYRQ